MLEPAIIEGLSSGGPVAILSVFILVMYRQDKRSTESRIHDVHEAHSSRLEMLLKKDIDTREKHTEALIELITTVKRLNGRS